MLFRCLVLFLFCLLLHVNARAYFNIKPLSNKNNVKSDYFNNRPIIGIVTEEVNSTLVPKAKSYVLASHVKFLESAGARVVPIWVYQSRDYYEDKLSKVNGIYFPGGDDLITSKGFGETGKIIFDIATRLNDNGDYFPMWGTCLGFELLNYLAVNKDWMKSCDAVDMAANIELVEGYDDSRMFEDLDGSLGDKMQCQKVAVHYHNWCITPKNFTMSGLDKYFKVLAVNQDLKNMTFVSIVEAYNYPFYGVAFHPEKPIYEWIFKQRKNIPHDYDSIRVSQYFANFFVNEARRNYHHFTGPKEENYALIYNYDPLFTGQFKGNPNEQTYFFTQLD